MNPSRFNKILVVDDSSDNLQLLMNLLTKHGYTVYPTSQGELALEFVQTTLPDLILLDIKMPGMDGFEVCRRLQANERTRSIPIVFLSALEDEQDKVKGFQAGGIDYITKPFQPEEMLARIGIQLRLRELTEGLEQEVSARTEELTVANKRLEEEISERKRSEEKLRRYHNQLEDTVRQRTEELRLSRDIAEAANKAKSAFLANMSHELRTPLNAILGFSSIVRKNPLLPEKERQNLDIINRSGEHLLALINDVLEVAKIEAGGVQLANTPYDLGGMVRNVADMMQMRARDKGLQLEIDQSSQFPRYIVGDEPRLRQVLINLIGNAIKYTEQGGVSVRLGTKHNERAHLLIEVEDSGPGIPARDQPHIFEPFVQLGEQGASKGTGLGLTITRQFVQLMGGSISLESTLGKGSLFRIDLPLSKATEKDIAQPKQKAVGEVVGLAPGQPKYRILVVEDQLDNQALLAHLMQSVGFQVKLANNGERAVELFQSWQPQLILMDRRMPVMGGEEATRRIRELPGGQEVKIVAVTASAFMEERETMLDAGMDDFVSKPYRPGEIYACLSKQLKIKFQYKDSAELQGMKRTLTPEMLSVLPENLRRELQEAFESLDNKRIEQLIQQVATYDQDLQKTLSQFADNFDYPAVLRALETE